MKKPCQLWLKPVIWLQVRLQGHQLKEVREPGDAKHVLWHPQLRKYLSLLLHTCNDCSFFSCLTEDQFLPRVFIKSSIYSSSSGSEFSRKKVKNGCILFISLSATTKAFASFLIIPSICHSSGLVSFSFPSSYYYFSPLNIHVFSEVNKEKWFSC